MKELEKDSFILIRPFMITELNLKGNSLLIYALIYGITVNKGMFYGSIEYIQTWCNASNRNVIDCLKELTDRGLITKKKSGNTVFYKANFTAESEESSQQSEESSLSGVKKVHSESEESSHNILDIKNSNIKFLNSTSSKTKSEPPKFKPTSFSKKDYEEVMAIYYHNREQIAQRHEVETISYQIRSYQSIIKPYFEDYGVEVVKQAVRNSINNTWATSTSYGLPVIFNRKKFDEYVANSKGSSSYTTTKQKQMNDAMTRTNMNTGNKDYTIF